MDEGLRVGSLGVQTRTDDFYNKLCLQRVRFVPPSMDLAVRRTDSGGTTERAMEQAGRRRREREREREGASERARQLRCKEPLGEGEATRHGEPSATVLTA